MDSPNQNADDWQGSPNQNADDWQHSPNQNADDWQSWADVYGPEWTLDFAHLTDTPTAHTSEVPRGFDEGWPAYINRNTAESGTPRGGGTDQYYQSVSGSQSTPSVHTPAHYAAQTCGTGNVSTFEAVFPDLSLSPRTNPPYSGQRLQVQRPRFEGDLYAATWVQGEGTERAGWCGYCSDWYKLKDSTFVGSHPPSNNTTLTDNHVTEVPHAIHTRHSLFHRPTD